jgi:hypothetical protein
MNGLWARRAPVRAGRSPREGNEPYQPSRRNHRQAGLILHAISQVVHRAPPLPVPARGGCEQVRLLRSWECGRGEWWEMTRAEVPLARAPRRDGGILQIPRRVWTDESVPVIQARKQASWRYRLHQLELQNDYSAKKRSSVFRRLTCFRGCPMNRKP